MKIPENTKRPNEKYAIGFEYVSPDLEGGASCSSCVVTISPTANAGLKVVGSPVVEATRVSQMVEGGEDGKEYYVSFKTTTSAGHIYKDAILVKVRTI